MIAGHQLAGKLSPFAKGSTPSYLPLTLWHFIISTKLQKWLPAVAPCPASCRDGQPNHKPIRISDQEQNRYFIDSLYLYHWKDNASLRKESSRTALFVLWHTVVGGLTASIENTQPWSLRQISWQWQKQIIPVSPVWALLDKGRDSLGRN